MKSKFQIKRSGLKRLLDKYTAVSQKVQGTAKS